MINEKLKKIKVIVTDIDGTLLNENGELGLESRKLIGELMKEDIIFVLATGRLHSATTEIAKELSLNGYIISLDGALIKSFSDDQTIFKSYLRKKQVEKALRLAESFVVNIVLCHSASIYYTENNSAVPLLLNKYGANYSQVESYEKYISGTLEVVCSSDMKSSIKRMEEKFNFPYSVGCNTTYFRSKKNENIFYLEIRKAGSSKGKAIGRLLKHLSLKASQAAVIGDWYNDIAMFRTKAVKVAVANAIPELINSADIVTTRTNTDDGSAEFFEMVLKSKRN